MGKQDRRIIRFLVEEAARCANNIAADYDEICRSDVATDVHADFLERCELFETLFSGAYRMAFQLLDTTNPNVAQELNRLDYLWENFTIGATLVAFPWLTPTEQTLRRFGVVVTAPADPPPVE
jgi:hypothetical protein